MLDLLLKMIADEPNTRYQFTFANGDTSTYMIFRADQFGVVGGVNATSVPILMPWANIMKIIP